MRNIRVTIEYDGTAYCGWQFQANGLTIQEVLESCLARMTGEDIRIHGSGRTDAGVHAFGQVASFMTSSSLGERNILMGINSLLPADIVIRELREVDPSFHARFDAKSKVYLYRICNRPVRSALERHHAWFIWEPLDLQKIREVLPVFKGVHDFASFCSTHNDSKTCVRTILEIDVQREGDMVEISVEADGFLRYMVRTIVGTLVEAGRGKCSPADVAAIMSARDRRRAGLTAPPQGLFLREVKYG